jgi:hypothetical protein
MPQDELIGCVVMPTEHYIVDGEGSLPEAYIKLISFQSIQECLTRKFHSL